VQDPDGGVAIDATPPDAAFTSCTSTTVPNVNATDRDNAYPSMSADGKELYLATNRASITQPEYLMVAMRTDTSMDFGTPITLPGSATSTDYLASPSISTNGLELFALDSNTFHGLVSTRLAIGGNWSSFTEVPGVDQAYSVAISGDGLTLYFMGRPGYDGLHAVTRNFIGAPWNAPTKIDLEGGIDRTYTFASVSRDDLAMQLSRPLAVGAAGIVRGTRLRKTDAFTGFTAVPGAPDHAGDATFGLTKNDIYYDYQYCATSACAAKEVIYVLTCQ
jgi:hypothetical protein